MRKHTNWGGDAEYSSSDDWYEVILMRQLHVRQTRADTEALECFWDITVS